MKEDGEGRGGERRERKGKEGEGGRKKWKANINTILKKDSYQCNIRNASD